jgi:hypothetical protein
MSSTTPVGVVGIGLMGEVYVRRLGRWDSVSNCWVEPRGVFSTDLRSRPDITWQMLQIYATPDRFVSC